MTTQSCDNFSFVHSWRVTSLVPKKLLPQSSFIPITFYLWSALLSPSFPASYNFPFSKSMINKLGLVSLFSQPFIFFPFGALYKLPKPFSDIDHKNLVSLPFHNCTIKKLTDIGKECAENSKTTSWATPCSSKAASSFLILSAKAWRKGTMDAELWAELH